jgi:NADPH2:quinone reductase
MGSLYVTSAGLADYTHNRAELLERAADLFGVVGSGAVRVEVRQRYPLAEAARAHRALEARRTIGSSILLP